MVWNDDDRFEKKERILWHALSVNLIKSEEKYGYSPFDMKEIGGKRIGNKNALCISY